MLCASPLVLAFRWKFVQLERGWVQHRCVGFTGRCFRTG